MSRNISEYVIETTQELIEKLKNVSSRDIAVNQGLLKKAKVINDSVLNIIKQQDIDLKRRDLEYRENALESRKERTEVLQNHNDIQIQKLGK